jgi:spore coat protein A, manganese oxidase
MRWRCEFLPSILCASALGSILVGAAQAQPQTPLPGSAIRKFVDPLPTLDVAGGPIQTTIAGASEITLRMCEFKASVMPSGFVPASGTYTGTTVWGYAADATCPTEPRSTYTGPVIVATRGTPTQLRFVNSLGRTSTSALRFWKSSTDQTLHWADPASGENMCAHLIQPGVPPDEDCAQNYDGPIPAVVHIHGGEVPPVLDGGPDAWFLSQGSAKGSGYYTKPSAGAAENEAVYRYPNTQQAAMLWFHDHVLGATRLNVYAGLAGAYPIVDPGLSLPSGLHPLGLRRSGQVDYLIPLVLQDRMLDTNGQLFFPNTGINPEHPFWIPEFVGDTIVVNGKAWPFLNVAPKRYRFLFINGSNARTYELFLVNSVTKAMGPPLWQIGTDGGYLDTSVKIDPNGPPGQLQRLLIMPGERADVIVDFAGFAGQTLVLRNNGRTPFPKGEPPNGSTTGQIIQIRVNQPFTGPDTSYNPALGTPLRVGVQKIVRLAAPAIGALAPGVTADKTRQLSLNEVIGPGGPLEILVNNTKWDGRRADGDTRSDFTAISVGGVTSYHSERPNEGDTEVWEIVNLTADAHPIHTHLTQFQLVNRQAFNMGKYGAAYAAAFPDGVYIPGYGPPLDYSTGNPRAVGGNPDVTGFLQGPARPPAANEAGWKDTVVMYPGEVARIAVRFAPMDKPIDDPSLCYPFEPNADDHGYVWHCHIIDHEDNEMMRPFSVVPLCSADSRSYVLGDDY